VTGTSKGGVGGLGASGTASGSGGKILVNDKDGTIQSPFLKANGGDSTILTGNGGQGGDSSSGVGGIGGKGGNGGITGNGGTITLTGTLDVSNAAVRAGNLVPNSAGNGGNGGFSGNGGVVPTGAGGNGANGGNGGTITLTGPQTIAPSTVIFPSGGGAGGTGSPNGKAGLDGKGGKVVTKP
jgi:hypothetical protein